MAQEYSYNDLVQMQEQAIRRVRDMQERARLTLQEQTTEKEEEVSPPPKEILSEEKPKEEAPPQPLQRAHNPFSNLLSFDKDKAVILPLLLLLGRESGDNILLMALMYIMA